MRRLTYSFFTSITVLITTLLLLQNTAFAHPYGDDSKKFGSVQLSYDDTSSAEYQTLIHKLDSFYKVQVAYGFNGSVLIGYQGKILYERYFGYADKKLKTKLTPNSASQLASTTKTFTATAILFLHQHKYLDINKKVNYYLPTFPYDNITVKMLLNHRAGLNDYIKWVPRYKKNLLEPLSNEDIVTLFAKYKPSLYFKPGTRFKYSNSNYAVLSRIIEEVTEMTYKDFMQQYIFKPLGMESTFVYDPKWGLPRNATMSYRANWTPYKDMFADGVTGDKGIYSTVRDMYLWDQSFYDSTLLNNETIELAYGPCSFETPGIKNYGLGWRMLCYPDGDKIIFHNGWWHGNNTVFHRNIKDNFTVIVLGNKYNSRIYHQVDHIYSIITNSPLSTEFEGEE
ncbi:MAG: serine hydrolase domain-containing protein [Flavipsychrobacter sp.]